MRELESGSGAGKHMEIFELGINFSIYNSHSVRQFRSGLMVIGNNNVDTHGNSFAYRVAAGYAAVNGNEDLAHAVLVKRLVEGFGGKPVSVVEAVRNKRLNDCAVASENEREQRAGGNAVSIVVAVNNNRFAVLNSLPQSCGGFFNTGKAVRIAESCQARVKEVAYLLAGDTSGGKIQCDRMREAELPHQSFDFVIQVLTG